MNVEIMQSILEATCKIQKNMLSRISSRTREKKVVLKKPFRPKVLLKKNFRNANLGIYLRSSM